MLVHLLHQDREVHESCSKGVACGPMAQTLVRMASDATAAMGRNFPLALCPKADLGDGQCEQDRGNPANGGHNQRQYIQSNVPNLRGIGLRRHRPCLPSVRYWKADISGAAETR